MFDLRKFFARDVRAREGAPHVDSEYRPSHHNGVGLEVEYQALIAAQFHRWGIAPDCITIEVRTTGHGADGLDVLVGMVRLAQWERSSALRVLLGLPLLEAKVRKTLRGTWLADFSHFGGLWLHSSEQLNSDGDAISELRHLLIELTPPAAGGTAEPGTVQG